MLCTCTQMGFQMNTLSLKLPKSQLFKNLKLKLCQYLWVQDQNFNYWNLSFVLSEKIRKDPLSLLSTSKVYSIYSMEKLFYLFL